MKPRVYIETSVISYYTARPSRDLIVAGHQQITEDWWTRRLPLLDPHVSTIVLEEISQGDRTSVELPNGYRYAGDMHAGRTP